MGLGYLMATLKRSCKDLVLCTEDKIVSIIDLRLISKQDNNNEKHYFGIDTMTGTIEIATTEIKNITLKTPNGFYSCYTLDLMDLTNYIGYNILYSLDIITQGKTYSIGLQNFLGIFKLKEELVKYLALNVNNKELKLDFYTIGGKKRKGIILKSNYHKNVVELKVKRGKKIYDVKIPLNHIDCFINLSRGTPPKITSYDVNYYDATLELYNLTRQKDFLVDIVKIEMDSNSVKVTLKT